MSDLISLANLDVSELEWRQPALGRKFELSSSAGPHARLDFQKITGSLALATTARATWSFKRQGMLKSHVDIRFADSDQPLATYEPNFSGRKGSLKYAGGQYLDFQSTNFFNTEWQWITPEGDGLIGFRQKGMGKPHAIVYLGDEAFQRIDLDLLLILGFYVLVLLQQDATIAT